MAESSNEFSSTNWCTGWFDGTWGHCCAMHDVAYTLLLDKWEADIALGVCVAENGWPVMGAIMTIGVMIFGGLFYKRKKQPT